MSPRQLRRWPVIVAVLISCSGCGGVSLFATSPLPCHPPDLPVDAAVVDGLYVLPEDGRAPVLDEIDRAVCTIDINAYLISDETMIDALGNAEARGVEIRIIHEEHPFGGSGGHLERNEALAEDGIEFGTGPADLTFTHAKYLIIDNQVAIITNQNFTFGAFESNRELGVITTDPAQVATMTRLFESDWDGTAPPPLSDRLVVSPLNARVEIVGLIESADSTIRLYAEVIRDDEIVDALSTAVQRGVKVHIVVNPPDDELDETVYAVLISNGVDLRTTGHIYIHAKAMVIDDTAILIGSHNPTSTSLDRNREVSLIVSDAVAIERATVVFESDWDLSTPYNKP